MNSGLDLTARYCFAPNNKKFCGPKNSVLKIAQFIRGEFTDKQYLQNAFSKFEVMFPCLQLIAEASGKKPFDLEVSEAYWQGNELLEKVSLSDWKKTALRVGKNSGWENEITEKYASFINAGLLPHHSFHVLASSLSTINEPEVLLEKINSCLITWGRVLNAEENSLVVERKPVILENNSLVFGNPCLEKVKNLFVECKIGDWVSMHWGFACKKLEKNEVQALEEFTQRNLKGFSIK